MASFESVADEYDAARPTYPAGVFDELGDLNGLLVLDVGAGTGIATRELLARGAEVVAVDQGVRVLTRAVARTPTLKALVSDGAALPVPDRVVDLTCFAQSWHWLDPETRVSEIHRVLRDGGRWAAWWSHARADGEEWFEEYWSIVEAACPAADRAHRDTDWGATIAVPDRFAVDDRVVVPWVRELAVESWLIDLTSHSYVAALDPAHRDELISELRRVADRRFSDGTMRVPYDTWLWIATKV